MSEQEEMQHHYDAFPSSGQTDEDIKTIKSEVSAIKERLEHIEVQIIMEFAAVNQQLAEIRTLLSDKPPTGPES